MGVILILAFYLWEMNPSWLTLAFNGPQVVEIQSREFTSGLCSSVDILLSKTVTFLRVETSLKGRAKILEVIILKLTKVLSLHGFSIEECY